MAKSQETFNKKEKEKKRLKKKKEKQLKREERKLQPKVSGFENMIAYVDEFGQLTDTPPDPAKRIKVEASSIELGVPKREKEEPVDLTGKVDFFDTSKGFGFIRETNTDEKYFVHVNGLLEDIKEGDIVTYELEKGMKGMNAVRVKLVKK